MELEILYTQLQAKDKWASSNVEIVQSDAYTTIMTNSEDTPRERGLSGSLNVAV